MAGINAKAKTSDRPAEGILQENEDSRLRIYACRAISNVETTNENIELPAVSH